MCRCAAVVECSSYQLEHPGALRFDAACVINLTADHVERHGSMEAYATAKGRVFAALQGPGTLAVLPAAAGAGAEPEGKAVSGPGSGQRAGAVGGAWSEAGSVPGSGVRGGAEGGAGAGAGTVPGAGAGAGPRAVGSGDGRTQVGTLTEVDAAVAMLERARAAAVDAALRASGGLGLGAGAVGGHLARIGALPGVVVDPVAMTATLQLPGGGKGHGSRAVDISALSAVGAHNANNAGVALLLAHSLNPIRWPVARLAAGLGALTPPPHRMQVVAGTAGGVQWVDDSKVGRCRLTLSNPS